VQADLSNANGSVQAVKSAIDTYGRLDGLVVNHAVLDPVERIVPPEVEEEDILGGVNRWKQAFDVNFFSVVGLLKAAVPHLRKTSGRVIFVSSGASTTVYPAWGAYSATKAAMNSLCRTLAYEEPTITSIAIQPGVVDTDMQREIRDRHGEAMGEESHKKFTGLHIAGKLLRPDQPGAVIANLVVRGERELSGKYISWDANELRDYQGV